MDWLKSSTLASEYPALASHCRTRNHFNQLHIHLENILAPVEFGYFVDLAKTQQLPVLSYPWLVQIACLSPELFESPQRFTRRVLSENVLLYQDPSRETSEKRLLVAFADNAQRLMMPVPVFLQCLNSRTWDVVLLRKGPQRGSYLGGLEGLSSDFPTVIRYIQTVTSARQYQHVATLGTSGGGFAAILAAILMNAARGVSVCGCPPRSPLGLWLRWQLTIHRWVARGPEFEFVYGADHDGDRAAALSLQSCFGGRLRPVADVDNHIPLCTVLGRGQLAEFLDEVLA